MSQPSVNTAYPPDRTHDETIALFKAIEAKFPSSTLGDDRWYLIPAAALCAAQPESVAPLYSYLISKPEYSTPEARQRLVRRLREALVKCSSVAGICRPIEAIMRIASIEREEDRDYSFSREHWASGPEALARGNAWLNRLYKHDIDGFDSGLFTSHKDFGWISRNITYGLFLSDHSITNDVETQLIVLSSIMVQNLRNATHWHLRGTRRVGVSKEDVEVVHQCIELVAEFARVRVDKVPRVADVEHEV